MFGTPADCLPIIRSRSTITFDQLSSEAVALLRLHRCKINNRLKFSGEILGYLRGAVELNDERTESVQPLKAGSMLNADHNKPHLKTIKVHLKEMTTESSTPEVYLHPCIYLHANPAGVGSVQISGQAIHRALAKLFGLYIKFSVGKLCLSTRRSTVEDHERFEAYESFFS